MFSAKFLTINITTFVNDIPKSLYLVLIITFCISLSCKHKPNTNKATNAQLFEQLADECSQKYPDAPLIQLKDFIYQSKETEWIIVDVRSQREQDVSIIPGAVTKDEFESNLNSVKNTPVLVYCTVGCRSGAYTKKLNKKGFKAFNLRGGILAWAFEGRIFVTPEGKKTYQAHVYGKKWDVLPSGYKSVW